MRASRSLTFSHVTPVINLNFKRPLYLLCYYGPKQKHAGRTQDY